MSPDLASESTEAALTGLPVARAQIEYLETVARLRGLRPTPAARARVLELGAGVGANLVPQAERYPQARFLGIDPSARRIAVARQSASEVELTNVELRKQSILEFGAAGTFDYIIADGLYSSVDQPARDKLLEICRDHLAPQGMALVGYKTYPGWHLHDMLRSMMLYDSRQATSDSERLSRAKMFLDFLKVSLTEETAYDALVQGELAAIEKQGADYLRHQYLQPSSHPEYFPDFVAKAKSYALEVAGDGVLGIRWQDYLEAETERQLAAASNDEAEKELFRDIVRNRTSRQTLLCHAGLTLSRSATPELLRGLYLEGPLRPERPQVDLCTSALEGFSRPNGLRISTPLPLVKAALYHLGQAWPDYVAFDELAAAAQARLAAVGHAAPLGPPDVARLEANLAQCVMADVIDVHSDRPSFVPHASDAPVAGRLIRAQALRGELVTNRRHEAVRLDSFERHLIELLDGSRPQSALIEHLAAAAAQGRLVVMDQQQRQVQDYDGAMRVFRIALPQTLAKMAAQALLVG